MGQPDDDYANLGPQVIFGMDPQGRCTLSVGPGLRAQGLRPGELVGQDLLELYSTPEDLKALRRALAGESFTERGMVNGRLLQTYFEPVHGPDGTLESVVGVATDLTEHVRTQEDLSRFKALAEDSQDFIAIADEDGNASYLNPRLTALGLSFSPERPVVDDRGAGGRCHGHRAARPPRQRRPVVGGPRDDPPRG